MSTPIYPSASRGAAALAWPAALALAAAMGIGRFAFTPVWPLMAQEAGLSLAQGGWLASANYVGYLLGALAAVAWPIRRLRGTLAASLLAVALLTLAMPLWHGMAMWCALRLAAGYASASAFICVAAWRAVPAGDPREADASAVTYAGVGAGIALTGLACLALAAWGARADTVWIALGGLALALSAIAWSGLRRQATPMPARSASAARAARLPRDIPALALHYGAFGVGYIVPATFLPAMAKEIIPDPAIFGWAWPLFGLAAAVSCLLVPRLARGRDSVQIWRAAQALMALGMLAVAVWHHIAAVIVAAVLVGGTFMVITQAGMLAARRSAGASAPRAAALMTAAFAAGQILGPLLASWAAQWSVGLPQVLAASATLLMLSAWRLGKITTDDNAAGHNANGPRARSH
ncbi:MULTISPECIES: YbfB/YjiJ family MFS transporter [Achromobacter]|uniref:YbfB/YjiJ family MFS transporter n=1 Tax=Alcaligenes xylosoxydans xylosoxydans TaxID=85698 RepID=A0A424W949_ALCXX|nr:MULTISPECIES: YbfB/YjiJ family MFS transporter [Achromobacter]MBC9907227.1 YbfB/YjiJ family MFS transporter [Achromobacter xylosoxidans]MBD0870778.1 YbfB/YjiJ family MFS transporter [Achromobacter xylosoxidans]MDH1298948.1 YbfB/YjiJ family MFS transporter [Achromobacter sp. GD03932]QNP86121.1 YbfB/YjiJ family MFS transporter [Achromobacter xylosoxidans]RPJ89826.1 YbfB/YjiJ family MFS transporter [Achromobacter xylosoxidans]